MEDPESLLNNTKKFLRSALISSKGGLPAEQVYRDYRDLVGEGIPYRRLGYETLDSFLSAHLLIKQHVFLLGWCEIQFLLL